MYVTYVIGVQPYEQSNLFVQITTHSILLMTRPDNFSLALKVLVQVINCKAKNDCPLHNYYHFYHWQKENPEVDIVNLLLKHVQVIERYLNIMMQLIAGWSISSYFKSSKIDLLCFIKPYFVWNNYALILAC